MIITPEQTTKIITAKDGVQRVMGEKADCVMCGKPCHRKGERHFRHVDRIVTRWYCGGKEGCGAYHNREPLSGAVVEPPDDWKEQRKAETVARRAERLASRPKREPQPRASKQTAQPLAERLVSQFAIDTSALDFGTKNDKGVGRVIVYEVSPELIAKLDETSQENVRAIQQNILTGVAIIGKYKEALKGAAVPGVMLK